MAAVMGCTRVGLETSAVKGTGGRCDVAALGLRLKLALGVSFLVGCPTEKADLFKACTATRALGTQGWEPQLEASSLVDLDLAVIEGKVHSFQKGLVKAGLRAFGGGQCCCHIAFFMLCPLHTERLLSGMGAILHTAVQ